MSQHGFWGAWNKHLIVLALAAAAALVAAGCEEGPGSEQKPVAKVADSTPEPKPKQPPVAVGTIGDLVLTAAAGASPVTVDADAHFDDPDDQILTYTARSSAHAIATASAAGSTVTVAAVAEGTATTTVTATDEDGLTASQTFKVTVNPAAAGGSGTDTGAGGTRGTGGSAGTVAGPTAPAQPPVQAPTCTVDGHSHEGGDTYHRHMLPDGCSSSYSDHGPHG